MSELRMARGSFNSAHGGTVPIIAIINYSNN
jgi:hypothetical protein